jgi:hypothetical protein
MLLFLSESSFIIPISLPLIMLASILFIRFRRRTLVAIGTHDLDTLQGPFTYEVESTSLKSSLLHIHLVLSMR